MRKRNLDVAVISDVHLGTYGCHAAELESYLKSIRPEWLVINGDFIDGWQFSKRYFPDTHTAVLRRILKMMSDGVKVVYVTGNHDEMLRRYSGFRLGGFTLDDKFLLSLDGRRFWFFHGDVFDLSMRHGKWLARLGGLGYDLLIVFNRSVNRLLERFGYEKYSFSKKVKNSVKAALRHINDFERTVAELAAENGYDAVVCGHIHEPVIKTIATPKGTVQYLNSGDWVENLTALEYVGGEWSIRYFDPAEIAEPAAGGAKVRPAAAENGHLEFPGIGRRPARRKN
ncbi:MAG: UDP-2,3-diacylglucosamine diphosphatase [Acidobacteria bacterium]|nr:UDP-2,3-diacylglucosamine diphosphatase [Acidobacteriota bacterium]